MPDTPTLPVNKEKKARLGRGLGSLFSSPVENLDSHGESNSAPTVTTQVVDKSKNTQNKNTHGATAAPLTTQAHAAPPAIAEDAQIWKIPIDRLTANQRQPRQVFDPGPLKELAASIKEQGILQPIVARRLSEREFEIIAGERRWRAAQLAGLHEVPVILKKVTDQVSFELAIIENIQRENLNPMEEAEAYDLLINEYSLTQQQVADKLGKDRSSIANLVRLLALPPELKLMVRGNELSAGHAKVILAVADTDTQLKIAKQVIEERLSVRATEKLVARAKGEGIEKPEKDAAKLSHEKLSGKVVESLASELQKLIGTKVTIDYAESKGRLSVSFYSDDQLTHIVERLRKAWEK